MIPTINGCAYTEGPINYAKHHAYVDKKDEGLFKFWVTIFPLKKGEVPKNRYSFSNKELQNLHNDKSTIRIKILGSIFKDAQKGGKLEFIHQNVPYSLQFYDKLKEGMQNVFTPDNEISEWAELKRQKSCDSILIASPEGKFFNGLFPREVWLHNNYEPSTIVCCSFIDRKWKKQRCPTAELYKEFKQNFYKIQDFRDSKKQTMNRIEGIYEDLTPYISFLKISVHFSECFDVKNIKLYISESNFVFCYNDTEYKILDISADFPKGSKKISRFINCWQSCYFDPERRELHMCLSEKSKGIFKSDSSDESASSMEEEGCISTAVGYNNQSFLLHNI